MSNNSVNYNRQSIRLAAHDYSQAGRYFITVCIKNHLQLFGNINNHKMQINSAGLMIKKWYCELANKYPNIRLREYIVMPNHFHGIIEITNANAKIPDAHVGTSLRGRPVFCPGTQRNNCQKHPTYGSNNQKYNASIFDMMDWFKTMTTNAYIRGVKNDNWQRFDGKLWQLRYWDNIIRDDKSYQKISEYIINNPFNWQEDRFYV
jgi:REP-associated tyrosine transposase